MPSSVPSEVLQAARDLKVQLARMIGAIDSIEHRLNQDDKKAAQQALLESGVIEPEFSTSFSDNMNALVGHLSTK